MEGPSSTGLAEFTPWRRAVEWANPDKPIPEPWSRRSVFELRTLLTLTDISESLAELTAYLEPAGAP